MSDDFIELGEVTKSMIKNLKELNENMGKAVLLMNKIENTAIPLPEVDSRIDK